MKKVIELGDTTTSDVQGTSATTYALEPTKWLNQINEAAKKRHYFAQFVYQTTLQKGQFDVVIPYRTAYLSTMTDTTTEGGAITYTDLNNLDGIRLQPSPHAYGIAISNHALRTNAVDLIAAAREELTYYAGDVVDQAVATGMRDATAATNSARGVSIVYGGSGNYKEADLAAGDVFTPELVADAKRKLMSSKQTYTDYSSGFGISSASKNPWRPEPGDPFVLFIAPEQENALLKDPQFVNAAEYGSDKIVRNGEIGEYLGVKIVVTDNTPSYSSGDSCTDGGSGTWATNGHRCIMAKPKAAAALAWGHEPELHVFDYPSELETRLVLEMSYATDSVHDDAIVWISVADE